MDECLIFQKLTNQELIILSALDHLDGETKVKPNTNVRPKGKSKQNNKPMNDSSSEDSLDDESSEEDD
jgi:hypothetical protein